MISGLKVRYGRYGSYATVSGSLQEGFEKVLCLLHCLGKNFDILLVSLASLKTAEG